MKLIGLIFCAFYGNLAFSQIETFSKFYDISGTGQNGGIRIETIGTGFATLTLSTYDNAVCTYLSFMDSTGEVKFNKLFINNRIEGFTFNSSDSTFLLWGDFPNGSDFTAFIMKCTFKGDTIWSTDFLDQNISFSRDAKVDAIGNIYLCGSEQSSSTVAHGVKISGTGLLIWHKELQNGFGWYAARSVLLKDDSTVLFSCTGNNYFIPNDINEPYRSGASLFMLNKNGEILWDTAYLFSVNTNIASKARAYFLPQTSTSFSLLGLKDTTFQTAGLNTTGNLCLYGLNDSFEVKWHHVFPFHSQPSFGKMSISTTDSSIVGCGLTGYAPSGGNLNGYPWIFKISSKGQLLWERLVLDAYKNFDNLNEIKETQDGGLIAVGIAKRLVQNTFVDYTWVLKMDKDGCLQKGCDTLSVTLSNNDIPSPNLERETIAVFPNPSSNEICVDQASVLKLGIKFLRIVSSTGRISGIIELGASNCIDLKGMIPESGLFSLLIYNSKGRVLETSKLLYLED